MWEEAYNDAQAKKQSTVSGVSCVHQVSCNTKRDLNPHTFHSQLTLSQIATCFSCKFILKLTFAVVANYVTCLGSAHMAPFICTR